MLIPFDMIAVMLFLGFYAFRPDTSPPSLALASALLAAFLLALTALSYGINRLALAYVRKAKRIKQRRQTAAVAETSLRLLLVASFVLALMESGFLWSLAAALGLDFSAMLFPQMAGIAVYLLFFVCAWLPIYSLHRQIISGQWTRWSFLVHKIRYNLYMLAAWIPFALFSEWLSEALAALPALFIAAAWCFPYILVKLWGCKPLEPGPVLDLAHELQNRTGAKFSQVLVWEPGGGRMQNAAAVGLFRPFRYLFLTPALIANMDRNELQGVILHELGHVKKRHLLFYMFTTLAAVNIAVLIGEILPLETDFERFAVLALLVLFYFRFIFGWMSRIMERQADAFALETTGSADGLVNALEKLAISAGNNRLAHSWHHLGVAERVAFLRQAERRPVLLRRHHALAGAAKLGGYAVSLAMIAFMVFAFYQQHSQPVRFFAPSSADLTQHWRRVMFLLPGNATGPLELAYSLASDPDRHQEAVALAAKAIALATMQEERDAAAKLIDELSGDSP